MFLRDFIAHCAREYGGKAAFIHGDLTRTWREMHERSDRLGAAMQLLGLTKGETSAILAHNRIELAEHWFACLKTGNPRAGVNWRYSLAEKLHTIRDCDARVLFIEANCVPDIAAHVDELTREGRLLVGIGAGHGLPLDYETLIRKHDARPQAVALADADRGMLGYTSGSTGLPKGVILSQRALREALVHNAMVNRYQPDDVRLYTTNPAGININQMCLSITCGMTTVLDDYETKRFLEGIERHRVTQITVVPTMLRRIIDEVRAGHHDVSSLKQIAYGTMPTTPALIRESYSVLGCTFIQRYGVSESAGSCVALRDAEHRAALAGDASLLTSIGRPMLHAEVSIRDDEGRPLPAGEQGTLWICSETVMDGYLNLPAETADALPEVKADGARRWLRTGDYGRMDERGYIYLGDRKKNMIISGGMNVYPLGVENALAEHPAVKEAVVVGMPHPEWGEAVVAAVALAAGANASAEELIQHCRSRVAKFEVPKHVEVFTDLPQGHTDKVNKLEIKRLLGEPGKLPWAAP